jgi:O-succinylbenzoate-CoA ligase
MGLGIGDWIARRAERTPGSTAVVDGATGARQSYANLDQRTSAHAAGLRELGVRRGDRVALVMNNSAAFLEILFAVAKLGAITVPVNFRLSPEEIAYILEDSRATVLVHDAHWAKLAEAALAVTKAPVAAVVDASRNDPFTKDGRRELAAIAVTEPVHSDDVAVIMYTSGTTGRPKGAMLTHGNMEWNAVNMLTAGNGLNPDDSTVAVAPLFHIGGLGLFTLPLLYAGGTVIVQEQFDPQQTLVLMAHEHVTVQFMVPTMWAALSALPDFDSYDLSSLRCLLCGGAPCPLPVIEFYQGKGLSFMEGFGMTELSPTALVLEEEFVRTKAGSVGRPFLHVNVRIVDEDDRDVRQGEVGELVLQGPNVFAGYWGLPEATADAKRGEWFHSGDLARQDEDGFITLVDRKKDMIISGGENVYPIEVEQVLHRHPGIADAAVIGVPHERWGETVLAVVVPAADTALDEEEVIAYCRERIAHFKCPRRVELVSELPRNATGKLLKRELRQRFTGAEAAVTR